MQRIDCAPADVGMDESKLAPLRRSIESEIANGVLDGSVVLVARHGRIASEASSRPRRSSASSIAVNWR